ncbi:uncharacterized protein LOC122387102 isoform X2 [Amphibalanus amphitrite]|uniref:uncharacterized protein LOC122387102 isoform X2 n=1 Tax=Amphibalanus amphitrite TaxID=1232801 RepID=UPI001C90F98A|nr:uncharacterized protein LOC122387102 isoform X2 [Amphibalanus amphitrite]
MRGILLSICLIGVILQLVTAHHGPEHLNDGDDHSQEAKFLLKPTTKTRTRTRIATTTTAAYYSCVPTTSVGSTACTRRRRRALRPVHVAPKEGRLMSSQQENIDEVDGARDGRLFHGAVTVYTTEFTTVTVTATSTNTAFTVSVSYGCTLTGMDLPPSC